VWSDGDPFVIVDRRLAPGWDVRDDAYERVVVGALARGEIEIPVGDGHGALLGHEADEGPLEVFRLDERELLVLIASYADAPDLDLMAADAAAADARSVSRLAVRSGELVVLRSAVPWSQATVAVERPRPTAPRDWGPVDTEALVVGLASGDYSVGEVRVDRERYGFDAWRLAPRA